MIDFKRIDHVLVCVPLGAKEAASVFYSQTLSLKEIPGNHPNGALWFALGDAELHVREEGGAGELSGRHPAFVVHDLSSARAFLAQQGVEVTFSSLIVGRERCFFRDPWGNRFELIEFVDKDSVSK